MNQLSEYLIKNNIRHHLNQGITICSVLEYEDGINLAEDLLYEIIDRKTALYLSGGKTPARLYTQLAGAEKLSPGAVGLVDERFGIKYHINSNELMIRQTGFLRYLEIRDFPFYPILQSGLNRVETAQFYDDKVRELHATYVKNIGILGIGSDGHTSSLAPNRNDFINPMFNDSNKNVLISEFNDSKGVYKERVGMTFLGLEMLDLLVVLVFGKDKKAALDALFTEGSEDQIPSRFFKRPEIAKKTLFITDQKV